MSSMVTTPPFSFCQRIYTRFISNFPLLGCLWPHSDCSSPTQVAGDDLELGLNNSSTYLPAGSTGLWTWITRIQRSTSVPDADQSATTTQRDDSAPFRRLYLSLHSSTINRAFRNSSVMSSMVTTPPLSFCQRIFTRFISNFPLLGCLWPHSNCSSPTQVAGDDLELGLNNSSTYLPAGSTGLWTWITRIQRSTSVPDADQSATTTQRDDSAPFRRLYLSLLNNFPVVGRLWTRSGSTSSTTDGRGQSSQGGLPVHRNDNTQPQPRWENTVISLTFQAVIGLTMAGQPPNLKDQLHPLHFFALVMLFAFACSFSAILLDQGYPRARAQRILEKMGYLFAALGFYLITSVFLPNNLTWICWVTSASSLVAFTLALIKG